MTIKDRVCEAVDEWGEQSGISRPTSRTLARIWHEHHDKEYDDTPKKELIDKVAKRFPHTNLGLKVSYFSDKKIKRVQDLIQYIEER